MTFSRHLIALTGYKNKKNLKNRFLPKSCVTVVFRPIPWFLAISRLRAMPKMYESTLFTLVDVSEKHRCIINCHSCAIHSCIIGVNKFVTQNHVTIMCVHIRLMRWLNHHGGITKRRQFGKHRRFPFLKIHSSSYFLARYP